jgi:NADP-dependent 3-hydroxy acid dehydrogenase YdfG
MPQAVVTGATSGIGRAIAIALREAGYEVVAIGRDAAALAALGAEYGIAGLRLDLSDREAISAALRDLAPEVLVNNAGLMPSLGPFCDSEPDDIARTVAVNLSAALDVTRHLAPDMRRRGRGHVFFTGSTAGHLASPNLAVYGATKAAIGAFAQALRLELAADNVRVTEIVAGRVETGLYRDVLGADARAAMYAGQSAVQPEDVAAMVMAVLALPSYVDVSRFDILPTRQATPSGTQGKDK